MNITIKAHHVHITDALKEYAEKKVGRLSKFFDHIHSISVGLDIISASNENEQQSATATITVPGTIIRGKETSKDMYASIDILYEKLEKQLTKYKEKLRDSKKNAQKSKMDAQTKKETPSEDLDIHCISKPIDPEDAVALLEERKTTFLVFRNIEKEQVCVVYPLESGEYGLIET